MALYVTKGDGISDTGEVITVVDATYQDSAKGSNVTIDAYVHESDTMLQNQVISAAIDWNDGKTVTSFPKTTGGLLHITATRLLPPGQYIIRLTAQNYRSPIENRQAVNYFVQVSSPVAVSTPQNYTFGPTLPRDAGYPNVDQWEFQINSDILILESSVKMLLLTAKGDRVMEPNYGTNIRKILFESQLSGVDSLIQDEIINSLAVWEPRVELNGMSLQRDLNNRNVSVNLVLISKLNKQAFETSIEFMG